MASPRQLQYIERDRAVARHSVELEAGRIDEIEFINGLKGHLYLPPYVPEDEDDINLLEQEEEQQLVQRRVAYQVLLGHRHVPAPHPHVVGAPQPLVAERLRHRHVPGPHPLVVGAPQPLVAERLRHRHVPEQPFVAEQPLVAEQQNAPGQYALRVGAQQQPERGRGRQSQAQRTWR